MRKTREYKGCELESPIYRQVAADFLQTKNDEWCHYSGMPSPKAYEHKIKRGKRS